uniref:Uncharacterized protein n=1 Tax=Pristionchus pacificus TaxID=54126 RepID=A0A2A6BZ56_PRIPA|eukprot:PDM71168.1 hypothetical protein PRIPAC_43551 [Pristionchus pacificus]
MQLILKLTEDKRNHIANERKRKRTRREMITMIEGMKKKEGKKEILIMVGLIGHFVRDAAIALTMVDSSL